MARLIGRSILSFPQLAPPAKTNCHSHIFVQTCSFPVTACRLYVNELVYSQITAVEYNQWKGRTQGKINSEKLRRNKHNMNSFFFFLKGNCVNLNRKYLIFIITSWDPFLKNNYKNLFWKVKLLLIKVLL